MKVLVACEFSQIVTKAFRKKGHEAMSCDLLPTEGNPAWHIQGDVLEILDDGWDMMIAFPPCTHLCSSGARYWPEKKADGRQREAIDFFMYLYKSCKKVCCENPVGILSSIWRKPDQYIQPWQFGNPYIKRTGLWLRDLPLLQPTEIIEPIAHWHGGCRRGGKKKDGTRTACKLPTALKYGRDRSITFQGIADAMAEQWG